MPPRPTQIVDDGKGTHIFSAPPGPPPPYSPPQSAGALPHGAVAQPQRPGAVAQPEDTLLVEDAVRNKIPAWTARLQRVFQAPVMLNLDFNQLTRGSASATERLKVVGPLVDGVGKLGGLLEDPSAVEQLVRAVESSLTDRGVIGEVLSQMPTLYISFVNMPGGGPEAKRLEFVAGELRCVGDFALGQKGVLTQDQIETFFELKFFAKERDLVGKCMASTIPEAVTRLKQVTKSRTFRLMFDLPRLLGGVTVPSKRLDTARLLVSQTGLSRKFDAASKMAERGINSAAATLEAGLTGENEQFKREEGRLDREVYTSPNVLQPLVRAIEMTCVVPDVAASFATAVQGVCFEMLPPKSPQTLVLRQQLEAPISLLPQADGTIPFRNCWLVYSAPFEDGKGAVFTERECFEILEAYFRGREKALVFGFLGTDLPKARSIIQSHTTSRVEVEILWSTFFHPGISIGAGRLEVAELVCGSSSSLLLVPLATAVDAVVKTAPSINVPAILAARISRIVIQSQLGKQARPGLAWGQTIGPPGPNQEPGAAVLVYNCAADRAHRGFLSESEVRSALRKLLNLPVPPEETGGAAMFGKATTELGRLGSDATKLFGKMRFGGKKKK